DRLELVEGVHGRHGHGEPDPAGHPLGQAVEGGGLTPHHAPVVAVKETDQAHPRRPAGVHHSVGAHPLSTSPTRASKMACWTGSSAAVRSACHWMPTTQPPSSSTASSNPSSDQPTGTSPSPTRPRAWWWWDQAEVTSAVPTALASR